MSDSPVTVLNERGYPLDEARLRDAVSIVLGQQEAAPESELSIVIADDAESARLNLTYRGIDSPTDVLSFPADAPFVEMPEEAPYLGDLIVAYPYASRQAEHEGHDLMQSLTLLVVHGTLHLLGYDHATVAQRAEMWAAQDRALEALDIPLEIVPALESYDHASE